MNDLDKALEKALKNRANREKIQTGITQTNQGLIDLHNKLVDIQEFDQKLNRFEILQLRDEVNGLLQRNEDSLSDMFDTLQQEVIDQVENLGPKKGEDYFTTQEIDQIVNTAKEEAVEEVLPLIPEPVEPVDLTDIREDIEKLKSKKPEKVDFSPIEKKIKGLERGILNRAHGGSAFQVTEVLAGNAHVGSNISSFDFLGPVVTANGSRATVDFTSVIPVYGTEYQNAQLVGPLTTTLDTFQNALTLNTTALPAGTYEIMYTYVWNHDANNSDFEAQFTLNGTDLGEIHKAEPKDNATAGNEWGNSGSAQRYPATRRFTLALTAGTQAIALNYRTDVAGVKSTVGDIIISIFRVL